MGGFCLSKKITEIDKRIEEGLKVPDNEPVSFKHKDIKVNLFFGTKTKKDMFGSIIRANILGK